jgi:hypothetical protein
MRSDNSAITSKAHELVQEAEEISSKGQRRICRLLRRLGVNQEDLIPTASGHQRLTPLSILITNMLFFRAGVL